VEQERYGGRGRMPMFEKHWLGMSYQLIAFRWAGAVGRWVGAWWAVELRMLRLGSPCQCSWRRARARCGRPAGA
jgi:hypothetical protein